MQFYYNFQQKINSLLVNVFWKMIIIDTTESIFPSITNSKTFEYVSHKMSFIPPTIPSTSVLWGFLTNLQSNYFIENHLWHFLLTFSQKFYWSVIEIIKAYGDLDTISFWSAIIDQNLTLLAKYAQYLILETT